ncbi:flagellar motor protein MotB [Thiomicrospira sp. ALE5]|uniref:OmpA/MotB family protein n=1 Tax=Thiomicrospira sp. ALE5 TaxID=748650 RepID=UPI0008E46FD8|nr:flagellar motor protein MotB [Thiomicrospira sp. ALE5]SFR56458.1 chemotaxis protein MotB [Thiomicrospira sp. ALE5]
MSENKCPPAKPCKKGAPGWMVTFADLMSLLMAFFALLYAMSSIDDFKFQQVAASLQSVFGDQRSSVLEFDGTSLIELHPDSIVEEDNQQSKQFEELVERVEQEFEQEQNVEIHVDPDALTIALSFQGEALFPSGRAQLMPEFRRQLLNLSFLREYHDLDLLVQGHTDRVPLSGGQQYRTNWDLSASRAAAVGEFLLDQGFIQNRSLRVEGRADSMPITEEGDFANYFLDRRVEVIMTQNQDTR